MAGQSGSSSPTSLFITLTFGVVAGALVGWLANSRFSPSSRVSPTATRHPAGVYVPSAKLADLEAQLAQEREHSRSLEEPVTSYRGGGSASASPAPAPRPLVPAWNRPLVGLRNKSEV